MKLPVLSSRQLCAFHEKEVFEMQRQKGSHRFYRHPDGRTTLVPIHANKEIGWGLLHAILKEIKMSREEFFERQ